MEFNRDSLTREDAADYLRNIKDLYDCCYEEDALDIAISTLESIDKIITEIEQVKEMHSSSGIIGGLDIALRIINKYTKEDVNETV